MSKTKAIIIGISLCIISLIVIYGSLFLILKDRIQYPFESDKISYIMKNKDYARLIKKDINKIEISSDENTKIIEGTEEINKVIANINNWEGYKTSIVNVPIGSKTVIKLFAKDMELTIYLSTTTISINNTHYKTTKNYLEQFVNFM